MDCKEARPLIDANADRELSAPDARRVEAHLAECPECRRESENVRALGDTLRAAGYYRAPESLRTRILAELPPLEEPAQEAAVLPEAPFRPESAAPAEPPRAKGRERKPSAGWRDWFGIRWPSSGPQAAGGGAGAVGWGGALVIALAAAAAGVTFALHRPAGDGMLADELVSSHVRALLSDRDIDVISTDQHTVKPWFNGRIDYSPPVEDLAGSGFPLVGGRLDYVAHRRVAVLIYRYKKHPLDVYVFPESSGSAGRPPETLVSEGYSLSRWHESGMTYWAITDATPDTLVAFKAALQSKLHGPGGAKED
ncbi:anti-sigma factor [Trinickia terrae]|uniref:Anti-sigma factor n=1 Tax=Trinickia terrae TaxID=2571161 RepID=A0A4V5PJ60_9BURK|nr:anti-sigma factor [Trinickia terrae]TKC90120.1 anti-sigma factor [Trinickia terrae]